jgi:tetratricopeptide (TPR) repeat protein
MMGQDQKNKFKEKVTIYKQKLIDNPEHPTAYYNMGGVLKKLGHLDQAIDAYKHQLEMNPLHEKSWNNMGTTLSQQGNYQEAEIAFTKALEIEPSFLLALTNIVELALIQQDIELCIHYINKILKLVGDKTDEFSVVPFLLWLTAVEKSYQPVLTAIEKRDPDLNFNWDFKELEPVIKGLRKSQQKIAACFIRYFTNQLSFSALQERLKDD